METIINNLKKELESCQNSINDKNYDLIAKKIRADARQATFELKIFYIMKTFKSEINDKIKNLTKNAQEFLDSIEIIGDENNTECCYCLKEICFFSFQSCLGKFIIDSQSDEVDDSVMWLNIITFDGTDYYNINSTLLRDIHVSKHILIENIKKLYSAVFTNIQKFIDVKYDKSTKKQILVIIYTLLKHFLDEDYLIGYDYCFEDYEKSINSKEFAEDSPESMNFL
jgi:hypothetical protein